MHLPQLYLGIRKTQARSPVQGDGGFAIGHTQFGLGPHHLYPSLFFTFLLIALPLITAIVVCRSFSLVKVSSHECRSCNANGSHSQRVPKGWDATALRWVVLQKKRRVGGFVPDQLVSVKMLRHCYAAEEMQALSALVTSQRNWHGLAGTCLSSEVVMQEGLGFLSPELFERFGQTRKLALEKKLGNCTALTTVQRQ